LSVHVRHNKQLLLTNAGEFGSVHCVNAFVRMRLQQNVIVRPMRLTPMRDRADLESIHAHSTHHRARVLAGKRCGCFYCLSVFAPAEILEWIDPPEFGKGLPGTTALCPHCGIDSVLPDDIVGVPLSTSLLKDMHSHWFGQSSRE